MRSDIFYRASELIYGVIAVCESSIATPLRVAVVDIYACSMIKQRILLFWSELSGTGKGAENLFLMTVFRRARERT